MAIGDKVVIGPGGNAQNAVNADQLDGLHESTFARVDGQIFTGNMRLPDSAQLNSVLPITNQGSTPKAFATLKAVFDFAVGKVDAVLNGTPIFSSDAILRGTNDSISHILHDGMLSPEENSKRLATTEWVQNKITTISGGGQLKSTTVLNPALPDGLLTNDQRLASTAWVHTSFARKSNDSLTNTTINGLVINGTGVGGSNPVTITTNAELLGIELPIGDVSSALASHYWVNEVLSATTSKPIIRQGIVAGLTNNSTMQSDFLTANNLTLTLQADSVRPFIVAFSNGFDTKGAVDIVDSVITNTLTINTTANKTNYIFIERNPSTGSKTLSKTLSAPQFAKIPTPTPIAEAGDWTPRASGSPYSDCKILNTNAGAWYDGVMSQPLVSAASVTNVAGGLGVGLNSGMAVGLSSVTNRMIVGARVVAPSNSGFFGGGYYNLSFYLQGSSNGLDGSWSTIASKTGIVDSNGLSVYFSDISKTLSVQYKNYRVIVKHDDVGTHTGYIAECVFLEFSDLNGYTHYWFDTNSNIMRKWNSVSGWVPVLAIPIAQCISGGATITSFIPFAINGYFETDWFDANANSSYTFNDGVGTIDKNIEVYYRFDETQPIVRVQGLSLTPEHPAQVFGADTYLTDITTTIRTATNNTTPADASLAPAGYHSIATNGMTFNEQRGQLKLIVKRTY